MFRHLEVLPALHVVHRLVAPLGAREASARRCSAEGRSLPPVMALPAVPPMLGPPAASGRAWSTCRPHPLRWTERFGVASMKRWPRRSILALQPPARDIRWPNPLQTPARGGQWLSWGALLRNGFPAPLMAPLMARCRALPFEQSEEHVSETCGLSRLEGPPVEAVVPNADQRGPIGQPCSPEAGGPAEEAEGFVVINFYKLTDVAEPHACVQEHLDFIHVRAQPSC